MAKIQQENHSLPSRTETEVFMVFGRYVLGGSVMTPLHVDGVWTSQQLAGRNGSHANLDQPGRRGWSRGRLFGHEFVDRKKRGNCEEFTRKTEIIWCI